MIRKCVVFGLLIASNCFATGWEQVIDTHKAILSDNSILLKQYRANVSSNSPAIADSRIKMIPIYENGEALVDLRGIENERIYMLPDPSIPFESPLLNSGLANASKIRMSLYTGLQYMVEALDRFSIDFGYEPGQVCIRVFEGLRDLNTQKELFEKKMGEILLDHPHFTLEEAEQETAKWVSPFQNNVPVHSTGAAVDIRLWDRRSGDFLDMGSFGVIWGTNKDAQTFSEAISDKQKKNRLYCLIAAEKAGLTNYVYEFWHFSRGDRYAAYWNEANDYERQASYGPIQ